MSSLFHLSDKQPKGMSFQLLAEHVYDFLKLTQRLTKKGKTISISSPFFNLPQFIRICRLASRPALPAPVFLR